MRTTLSLTLILGLVAEVATADFTFGIPTNLGPTVNSEATEQGPSLSVDGLELYFSDHSPGIRLGGQGRADLWVTTRPTKDDPWGVPVNLGPTVNSSAEDEFADLSADGLSLYFSSNRAGGLGQYDLWVTTRETKDAPWGAPVNLGSTVNSQYSEGNPSISADGLSLYFSDFIAYRPGGYGGWDLYVTTRATLADPWGAPVNLGATVNSPALDVNADISADGLALFLESNRPGSLGMADLWMTTRTTQDSDWGPMVRLGPTVNAGGFDAMPDISSDGSTLYFCAERAGGLGSVDLWQVSIDPVVDFNGDGKVDGAEILAMADRWGTDDSFCDIGSFAWGDGVVDVEDLKVLAKYIGQPVDDPTLIGHWPMDETEGIVVQDIVGGNHGTVLGLPQWQPQAGRIDGALELNGITFITAKPVLSPADGAFSVLAWIKGGAPGQSIVSQSGSANWLMADAATGALMTELNSAGRTNAALYSEAVITDGNWHRIAFSWDNVCCRLYVDGVLVAEDAQEGLAASSGKVTIGAGKNMAPGTFWTGLIDDVRIYNRAVRP